MPRETIASLTGKIAALQDQLTLSEARHAEAERSRLQGYIDRVREEQGEGAQPWGPGHYDFDRLSRTNHRRDYSGI